MNRLLDIIDHGDVCSLTGVIIILVWLGSVFAGDRQKRWGGALAVLSFLAYGAYALCRFRPGSAEELFAISLRALVTSGVALGLSWLILPIVTVVAGSVRRKLGASAASSRAWLDQRAQARRDQERRRRADEAWRQAAPERERARQQAEQGAKIQAAAQKRRDDARAACELQYHRHAHVLGDRFPKATFEEFVKKYMGDEQSPEYVEERGRQLQDIIKQHVEQIEPPPKAFTIESLATWYQTTKQLIDKLPVDDRYKQVQLAHLNARYAALMQSLMEALQP